VQFAVTSFFVIERCRRDGNLRTGNAVRERLSRIPRWIGRGTACALVGIGSNPE
jgi:hypothetical protein